MRTRHAHGAILVGMALIIGLSSTTTAAAQAAGGSAAKQPVVRSTDTGADMFRGYCAPCHGMKGVGDGPAAAALKTKPADLTRLAANNKGQYPSERVAMVLQFGVAVPAHGSTDMPTWGYTFRAMGDEASVTDRVMAISRYLQSIQVK